MPNEGIVEFYYTNKLPPDSIAIAKITSTDFTPNDLISINNLTLLDQGPLSIWKNTSSLLGPADFTAPDLNQSIMINGETEYYIGNQFFEITNVVSTENVPLYYKHVLPFGTSNASILDGDGNVLAVEMLLQNSIIYHSQVDGYYKVRYVDSDGFIQIEMLLFTPVIKQSIYTTAVNLYTYTAKALTVFTAETYYLRFTQKNGYQVLTPYTTPSNLPWFVRIRYGLTPTPPEWATQSFVPYRPYLLATWVTGKVLNSSTIQFERANLYNNVDHLPDVLVFDKDNQFKYALDGTALNVVSTKGYLYNWKKGLISEVDNYKGRLNVGVDLDPTDLVFGFYSYQETDIVYTAVDVNPFTNPSIKNSQVTFYLKTNGADTTKYLYYVVNDTNGNVIQTNDLSPSTGNNQLFSQLVVGASVSTSDLTVTDIRQRGGGLTPSYQNIPQAANFWDLGYWDGKPYPVSGGMIIYLPQTLLNTMSESDVQNKIESILPLGTLAVIKYYNQAGEEY